jgi:F420H2 dehydrogenase subunit N
VTGQVWVVLPLMCLAGGAFALYLVARVVTRRNDLLALFAAGFLTAALVALLILWPMVDIDHLPTWGRAAPDGAFLRADPGALVIASVALVLGVLVTVYSGRYLALDQRYQVFYPLLLLLVAGLIGMLLAADLFNLYLFCELMSVAAYVLVAFRRRTGTAIEAGFKYLVMGSVGTVTILLGVAFVYRETGSTALLQPANAAGPWGRAGLAFLLVGLGLKSAIVPLHTWLPDAHGRAPSSVSAMLSGIVVQSTFYVLLKVGLGLGFSSYVLGTSLIVLSLFNMTLGNGMALVQTHTKRMLGYSTIAQMGYVMLSVGIGLRFELAVAVQAGFFLIVSQAVMKGLAFLCKGACHFYRDASTVEQLRGTATQLPVVAVAFTVALVGLAGVPPLAGFTAKWFILRGALQAGKLESGVLGYVGMAALLLNALLALGYYLPLVGTLFAQTPQTSDKISVSPWMTVPILTLVALVLAIGLYPDPWLSLTRDVGIHLLIWGR